MIQMDYFLHLKITVMENVILDKIDDDVATRTCVVVVMPDKTYGVTYNKCDEAAVLSMFVVVTTLRNNVTMLINRGNDCCCKRNDTDSK